MSTKQCLARLGACASFVGAPVLLFATMLHPMAADPNDALAAFAEYAADRHWIASHLGQFLGFALLGVALFTLPAAMEHGRPSAWARIGAMATTAGVAAAAALQAVDGVALRVMVGRWSDADGDARERAFEAAFAVRQIEIGMASLLSLTFGLAVLAFGVSMLCSRRFSRWLGWMGILGGIALLMSGTAQAYTGFSDTAMMVSMSASCVLLAWAVLVGIRLWRLAPTLAQCDAVA